MVEPAPGDDSTTSAHKHDQVHSTRPIRAPAPSPLMIDARRVNALRNHRGRHQKSGPTIGADSHGISARHAGNVAPKVANMCVPHGHARGEPDRGDRSARARACLPRRPFSVGLGGVEGVALAPRPRWKVASTAIPQDEVASAARRRRDRGPARCSRGRARCGVRPGRGSPAGTRTRSTRRALRSRGVSSRQSTSVGGQLDMPAEPAEPAAVLPGVLPGVTTLLRRVVAAPLRPPAGLSAAYGRDHDRGRRADRRDRAAVALAAR